jgi:hypothetical protein
MLRNALFAVVAVSAVLVIPGNIRAQSNSTTIQKYNDLSNQEKLDALKQALQNPTHANAFDGTDLDPATVKLLAEAEGIYQTFGAVFTAYGAFGDGGTNAVPAAQSGFQTEAVADVAFESEHYGWNHLNANGDHRPHQPEFSFGGSVGLYPSVVMENLTVESGTLTNPSNRPMFQDALHWNLGPHIDIPLFAKGEANAYVDMGQNILVDSVTSFKQGDLTVTATPVSNGVGRSAFFGEFGAQLKLLDVDITQAHTDKTSALLPKFFLSGGYRRDNRFAQSGDLAKFDSPQDRVFFKFLVSLSKIFNPDTTGKAAAPASFDFGVDYERPITSGSSSIPGATRVIVSADLDIMKLFRPAKPQ